MKKIIFGFLLIAIYFTSCTNNKKDVLLNAGVCDTSSVKFSTTITTMMQTYCNSSSCHGGSASPTLVTYSDISSNAEMCYAAMSRSSNPMPKGANQLDACTISKLNAWINAGKLNN